MSESLDESMEATPAKIWWGAVGADIFWHNCRTTGITHAGTSGAFVTRLRDFLSEVLDLRFATRAGVLGFTGEEIGVAGE